MKRREFLKQTGLATLASALPASITVYYDQQIPQLQFAANEIQSALRARGAGLVQKKLSELSPSGNSTRIVLLSDQASARSAAGIEVAALKSTLPQSYAVGRRVEGGRTTYTVLGSDAAGAMYGGLDVAEAIRLDMLAEIGDQEQTPHIARRGIKFNIPLDVRTPSYSDCSDAAQHNIPEMWGFDFWREFLDEMARDRYNVLSLWNLHPFPSMVKVPEYPDVALNDVLRTTITLPDNFSPRGEDMVRPEMLRSVETVKKITIDEKIQFWRSVMQYAQDRGIEVYLITWNIFVWGAEGKYGITSAQDNPTTIDYMRKSVREAILTYPLLAGIGITAGEHMQNRKDDFSSEKWLWKTYGEGIRDAKKIQPGRRVRLIHRYHESALGPILDAFGEHTDTLDLSYKYSVAHMYSSPAPPFAKASLEELPPRLRMWMTVRNDDIYTFRWGDPDYARDYVRNLPGPNKLAGYYMGPDGYIWGREFVSTEPDPVRQLVIKKQWYSFMLWGRLSYNPNLSNAFFQKLLAQRFPGVSASSLFEASSIASKIIPQVTRFFWQDIDLKWFPEACLSHPRYRGFFTVKHFMAGECMQGSGILSISQYRASLQGHKPAPGITPLQVADNLSAYSDSTFKTLAQLRTGKDAVAKNKELRLTLGDLEAMAHLGRYYSEKIRGATNLALYELSGEAQQKQAAIQHLEEAVQHWKNYASTAGRQYKPQLLNRVGHVDLMQLTAKVQADVEMARSFQPK